MPKLTKNEQRILTLAARNLSGILVTLKYKNHMTRDLLVIFSLRKKGLLKQVDCQSGKSFPGGNMVMHLVLHDQITDAGRQALEDLS